MFGVRKISTDQSKIDELLTRGVAEIVQEDSLRKKLMSGKRLRIKLGIDPTSPNLHIGRMVNILKLRDFQDLGHQVVFIVGDATGVIGDTSDKESERPMLSQDVVIGNAREYFKQASLILGHDFEKHYNSKWLDRLSFSKLGEIADQFSLADFIARDNIKRRLDAGTRVSLRETLYPLMQGYDSVNVKADVEIGGTDQWFNLLAGRPIQEHFGQEPQDIMTHTLIPGLDGRKMSSSWGNTIYVTDSPHDMYGKVMSLHDDLLETYFESCTRVPMGEVKKIMKKHPKEAKMRLAFEIVTLYHGRQCAEKSEEQFTVAFAEKGIPRDVLETTAKQNELLMDVLLREKFVPSKTEFRRLVSNGAISNLDTGNKINNTEHAIDGPGTFKIGKHKFIKINTN